MFYWIYKSKKWQAPFSLTVTYAKKPNNTGLKYYQTEFHFSEITCILYVQSLRWRINQGVTKVRSQVSSSAGQQQLDHVIGAIHVQLWLESYKKKQKNIDRLINWKKKTTKINMNEGVNTILGLWSVPLNCSFTWQCSLGISVTGIVISHHIIGMTLLSCCWVTSRFRLSKHTLYKVFFYLKYYHFIIIFLNPAGTRLHKHTKCLIFL